MMSSWDCGKAEVCAWIREHFAPDAFILDVGACDGKWRRLLPEYQNMDAVEAFAPHCEKIAGMYRTVYNADATRFVYSQYDLIIFGDVIEHMSVPDAQKVLQYARPRCRDLIVGVPYLYPQAAFGGNPWEEHKQPDLTAEIFAERYPELEVLVRPVDNYCYYHKAGGGG